jgi:hypothetical protein
MGQGVEQEDTIILHSPQVMGADACTLTQSHPREKERS